MRTAGGDKIDAVAAAFINEGLNEWMSEWGMYQCRDYKMIPVVNGHRINFNYFSDDGGLI